MLIQFVKQNNSEELLLFFTGWGHCSNTLSKIILPNCDVLVVFDYRNKSSENELLKIIGMYKKVNLLAWSFGVFVANELLQNINLNSATAINGTIKPIDNENGIPNRIFDLTLNTLNPANMQKFTNKMCGNSTIIDFYEACKPNREFEEQKQELSVLKNWVTNSKITNNIFQCSYISLNDAIFPTQNQKNSWLQLLPKENIKFINSTHFPFYNKNLLQDFLLK